MYGYIKVGAAVPKMKVADCRYNSVQIIECIKQAAAENVRLLAFPELCVSGYTCGDMFFHAKLLAECEEAVALIAEETAAFDMVVVLGAPLSSEGKIYNCAVVIHQGTLMGIVPKTVLSEHGQFNEKRWFSEGMSQANHKVSYCGYSVPFGRLMFKCLNYEHFCFAVEICADLWSVVPPSGLYSLLGATVILNLSASPSYAEKHSRRVSRVKVQSEKCMGVYVYTSSSIGESTADSVFDGQAIIAELGEVVAETGRYSIENQLLSAEVDIESAVLTRRKASEFVSALSGFNADTIEFSFEEGDCAKPKVIPPMNPYAPKGDKDSFYDDIFNIQAAALYRRLSHTGIKRSVIGVSGGLDSTLALLVAVSSHDKLGFPRKSVLGVTMPGFGTSGKTHDNALELMEELGVSSRNIPIEDACIQHFKDIGHSIAQKDTVYENAQARERTQILMDIANMENGLVVGTGDMSELALGWATYNGDHMSMYNVNCGLPKTVIRALTGWLADKERFGSGVSQILRRILSTPISPELLPTDRDGNIAQKTEDLVGPYELHDYFMYYFVHKCFSPEKIAYLAARSFSGVYNEATIAKWLGVFCKRFFGQQFKRSCSPDGPKVLEFGLSQRNDLKIPSDICGDIWQLKDKL